MIEEKGKCDAKVEQYSRITGYFRNISNWNKGKAQEFKDRKLYTTKGLKGINDDN